MTPQLMEEAPPIDLNELKNWGRKGVIFGDRADLHLEVVPFTLSQGGRIKKYSEDKIIDIEGNDELNFCNVKSRIILRYRMFSKECVILKYPYEKFKEPEPIPALLLPADVPREQGTSTDDIPLTFSRYILVEKWGASTLCCMRTNGNTCLCKLIWKW